MTQTPTSTPVSVQANAFRTAADWLYEVAGTYLDYGAAFSAADALYRQAGTLEPPQDTPTSCGTLTRCYQIAADWLYRGANGQPSPLERESAGDALYQEIDRLGERP